MSRAQEGQAFDTASNQNKGYYNNAQNSYAQAQNGIGDYESQLSKYGSSNPYVQGGQFQTSENQVLANTSDAGAQSAGQRLQSQALRTGQNSAGDIAATQAMQQEATRNLSGEEAGATQERIGKQAQYNQGVLEATAEPAKFEAGVAGQQAEAGNSAAGNQVKAGETPSWLDEFGDAFAQNLGSGVGKIGAGAVQGALA